MTISPFTPETSSASCSTKTLPEPSPLLEVAPGLLWICFIANTMTERLIVTPQGYAGINHALTSLRGRLLNLDSDWYGHNRQYVSSPDSVPRQLCSHVLRTDEQRQMYDSEVVSELGHAQFSISKPRASAKSVLTSVMRVLERDTTLLVVYGGQHHADYLPKLWVPRCEHESPDLVLPGLGTSSIRLLNVVTGHHEVFGPKQH